MWFGHIELINERRLTRQIHINKGIVSVRVGRRPRRTYQIGDVEQKLDNDDV